MVIIDSFVLSKFVLQIVQFVQARVTVTNYVQLVSYLETGYGLGPLTPAVMTDIRGFPHLLQAKFKDNT
jgi:hypothetical protein